MNWDQIEGNWKQASGALRKKWSKLTDDDLGVAKGNRDILAGKLQERYGIGLEEARKEVAEFTAGYDQDSSPHEVAIEGGPVDTNTLKIGT